MLNKITALYCRYSRDDGQETENASITHQRALLKEYAESNGLTNLHYYADDGYTGTDFNRPDFQRMMNDVKSGLVSTILVKDMSRIGRNYILVGQLTEFILPEYCVRIIGVTDNFDSDKANNEIFPFESILSDLYCADISKKVRSAKRSKGMNGGKLATHPVYGYKVVEGTVDTWEIDENVAPVVRYIFETFLNEDISMYAIADRLREKKILTRYSYFGFGVNKEKKSYKWTSCMVKEILSRQEYVGDTINFRTRKPSYKLKKIVNTDKESWVIIRDEHPAIISREMFEAVQEKLKINSQRSWDRNPQKKDDVFFRGKIYCSMCGCLMHRAKLYGREVGYKCYRHASHEERCPNTIRELPMRNLVLKQLKSLYIGISEHKEDIYRKLGFSDIHLLKVELDTLNRESENMQKQLKSLYEQKIKGEISLEQFKDFSESYMDRKEQITERISEITKQLNDLENNSSNAKNIIDIIESYDISDFETLQRDMCDTLIEKMVLGECIGKNVLKVGTRSLEVCIYGLGKISDLVDLSVIPYSERVKELMPQLIVEQRCDVPTVADILGIKPRSLLKVLYKEENTTFTDLKDEIKRSLYIEAVLQGKLQKDLWNAIGYRNCEATTKFIRRVFGMGYYELRKKILSGEIK